MFYNVFMFYVVFEILGIVQIVVDGFFLGKKYFFYNLVKMLFGIVGIIL